MDAATGGVVRALGGPPERAFEVGDIHRAADGALVATQHLGPAVRDDAGRVQLSGLGVLVDDVLGYALIEAAPEWSVSTEVAIDVLDDLPAAGDVVCTARVVRADASGALVAGSVSDATGREVARCLLRGRFVPGGPVGERAPAAPTSAPSIDAALGVVGSAVDGVVGASLTVTDASVNPVGTMHGGMYVAVLERVAALAVPAPGRTASVRAQLVRAAPLGSRLALTADVLHPGRSLAVVQAAARDDRGRACALATVVRH